jgi:hypothetical protein
VVLSSPGWRPPVFQTGGHVFSRRAGLVTGVTRRSIKDWRGCLRASSRRVHWRARVPCPAMLRLQVAHDGICFSRPQFAMICCHSAIERPYFFSTDGKYEAGPCFGQGGACSTTLSCPFVGSGNYETSRADSYHRRAPDASPSPASPPPACLQSWPQALVSSAQIDHHCILAADHARQQHQRQIGGYSACSDVCRHRSTQNWTGSG